MVDFNLFQIVALFLGFSYFQLANDQTSIQNKSGLILILLMQTSFNYIFMMTHVSLFDY